MTCQAPWLCVPASRRVCLCSTEAYERFATFVRGGNAPVTTPLPRHNTTDRCEFPTGISVGTCTNARSRIADNHYFHLTARVTVVVAPALTATDAVADADFIFAVTVYVAGASPLTAKVPLADVDVA